MWFLPAALIIFTLIVAIPLSKYIAWIMEGRYRPWAFLGWIEKRLDTGPMNWKQYTAALLIFNTVLFVWGIRRVIASAGDAAKRLTLWDAVPNHHL